MNRILSLIPGVGAASGALRFLTSTVGIAILVAAISFGAGRQSASGEAELTAARTEIATLKKDRDTARAAAALAGRQTSLIEAKARTNQERVHALELDLQKRSRSGSCSLTDDDVRRLRDIR